jgi:hypothetical protein
MLVFKSSLQMASRLISSSSSLCFGTTIGANAPEGGEI